MQADVQNIPTVVDAPNVAIQVDAETVEMQEAAQNVQTLVDALSVWIPVDAPSAERQEDAQSAGMQADAENAAIALSRMVRALPVLIRPWPGLGRACDNARSEAASPINLTLYLQLLQEPPEVSTLA